MQKKWAVFSKNVLHYFVSCVIISNENRTNKFTRLYNSHNKGGVKLATIRDVASKCGVSVSTVSKAFNGYADINEATRSFILKKATELGYVPNSHGRFKSKRTYNLGVLFVDLIHSEFKNEYFAHVLTSFNLEAEKQGYDVTLINRSVGNQKMTYLNHCKHRNFDGVCIACIDFTEPETLELVNSDIPVVTIDHTFSNSISILSDNYGGMKYLVQYIISQGHKKVAYIHGNKSFVTHNRIAGFTTTMMEYGLDVPPEYLAEAHYHDPISTGQAVKRILSLPNRPTCIIMPDDYAAIGGLNVIRELGLRVPDDISLAGFDGLSFTQIMTPRLTTVKQDTDQIGTEAARQLIHLIENPMSTSLKNIELNVQLLTGDSVKHLVN